MKALRFRAGLSKPIFQGSGSFNSAGTQAGSANIHLMNAVPGLNANRLDVRLPHVIASSMRMAHIVSEVSCLFTNCTLCHGQHLLSSELDPDDSKIHNISILSDAVSFCKQILTLLFQRFFSPPLSPPERSCSPQ